MEKKQPRSLYILSFVEIWDRFNYYGISALLILYLTKVFAFSDHRAYEFYGAFVALSFGMPVIGGFLADRFLGFERAIILGGIAVVIGNVFLLFPHIYFLQIGIAFVVCGIGLFKPNLLGFVGTLYGKGDARRDSGFTIFYVGMNAGAICGPVIYGIITVVFGWHAGFLIGGLGMLFGIILFIFSRKHFVQLTPQTSHSKVINKTNYLFYFGLLLIISIISIAFYRPNFFDTALGILYSSLV